MNLSAPDEPYRERDQQIQVELAATRLAFINAEAANANVKEAEKNVAIHAENDFGKHYAGEMETLSRNAMHWRISCVVRTPSRKQKARAEHEELFESSRLETSQW